MPGGHMHLTFYCAQQSRLQSLVVYLNRRLWYTSPSMLERFRYALYILYKKSEPLPKALMPCSWSPLCARARHTSSVMIPWSRVLIVHCISRLRWGAPTSNATQCVSDLVSSNASDERKVLPGNVSQSDPNKIT